MLEFCLNLHETDMSNNGMVIHFILFPAQTKLPLNDLNNARLEGDVMKLLQGYDASSEYV